MANRFLSNIKINDAYTFPASDGTSGQVITTDGAGNLTFSTVDSVNGPTVVYQDNFTGDDSTVSFTLSATITDEVLTQVYIDGVYQSKTSYSTSGTTLTFDTAPATGHDIEVITLYSASGGAFDMSGVSDNDLLVYNASTGLFESTKVVNNIRFEGGTLDQGTLSWNVDEETLDLTVSADVTYQIGQELGVVARNLGATGLANGSVVKVTGASGNKVTVETADYTAEIGSSETFAVVTEYIGPNSTGHITTNGLVRGLDTSLLTEGVAIWLGANGAFTQTKPLTPNHLVHIGWVVRSHATEGAILVRISNGWEMEELHDVLISSIAEGELLVWDNTNNYWKNSNTITAPYIRFTGDVDVDGDINIDGSDLTSNSTGFNLLNSNVTTVNAFGAASQINMGVGSGELYMSGSIRATGSIESQSSIKVADDTSTASASNVGALRYREDANNSYVDMCMQTGASTYAWVNIVQNNW
jgi:hypothetical protein